LPTTVLRIQIQAGHRLARSQSDRQLQLCVPLVGIDGPSYRMRSHQARAEALRTASTAGKAGTP
jgi:hypothetical protein